MRQTGTVYSKKTIGYLDMPPNKFEEATAYEGHMTARGGPQLPWQRLEAAAALVKQVCDRDKDQSTTKTMIRQALWLWMGD